MRIEQIRIDGFGRLENFDTGPDKLGSLVVVLGPNEAGKSTLFSFLTTALYGFQPASRELSPHVPWGAEEAAGEITLRLEKGGCAVVSRRLRSSPTGTLTIGDASHDLRNRPLRWVEHVPRAVFRQVFAITLAELAGLDEETWAGIQDRVLVSMGASDLKSARRVAEALEQEAGEIWRPNRRGNQRLRDLQDEIRALRARRSEAIERDRQIRTFVEERESVALRLKEAREARHLDQVALERVQDLLPLKRQLERIDALRRAGGPRSDLVELPEDLVGYRDDLETRLGILRRDIAAIDADLIEPDAAVARFDEASAHLIEHRDAIAAFATRSAGGADDRVRLTDVRVRREESELEIAAAADNLLTAPPTESVLDAVEAVSVELLRDRVARLDRSSRGRAPEATAAVESGGSTARGRASGAVALVAAGAALLAWGLLGGPVVAAAAGAACLGVGVTLALLRPDRSIIPTANRGPTLDPIPELRREIEQMVSGLPVRSEYLDPPATPLPTAIERLQKAIAEARAFGRTEQGLAARIAALDEEALRLRALLGRGSEQDSAELALTLDREVREAERIRDAAEVAERERARVLRTRATAVADLTEVEDRIAAIEGRIWQLAAGAAGGRPIDVLHKRLEAHARADRIEEELQNAHPDLTDRVEQIRTAEAHGLAWTIDDEELAERKRRLEELGETIEKLIGRGEALERDIAHFRDRETVDTVDSEIESLREEEARLVKERDRKWLLAKLVREADRRFREEHQPDLLRRASGYLERLTGGRYDRLLVDEESDGDLFQLLGPQLPAPVALARPISTGTLEQAYLSLRLAIVDHLDPSEDRLPLFVDEAFVNWDDDRRGRGLEALSEVSRTRQVFAFTCHPEMADELRRRGACVIRLWP